MIDDIEGIEYHIEQLKSQHKELESKIEELEKFKQFFDDVCYIMDINRYGLEDHQVIDIILKEIMGDE